MMSKSRYPNFEAVSQAIRILASDGIVVGTVMAVVLNLVLPESD
jgi:xanthine/uracil permease